MIENFLINYGLIAVFLIATVEVDVAPIMAGVVAHLGYFDFFAATVVAACGAFASDSAWYWLGRWRADSIRASRLYQRTGARVERLIQRFGWWQLPVCRLFYGTRVVTMTFFGIQRRPFRAFLLVDAASCLFWSTLLTGLGFILSGSAELIIGRLKRVELWLLLILLVVISGAIAIQRLVQRGEKKLIGE